jgi:Tfp pilus assembly protein PilO
MRKLSRFEKLGVVAAVIIACSYLYMKRVYEPQEKKLKATVAQLNKVIGEVNGLKATPSASSLKRSLAKKKEELSGLEEQMKRASIHGTAENEISDMFSRVGRLMERNGLTVLSVMPKGGKNDGLFQWSLFEVSFTGGYFNFLSFLDDVIAMPNAVKIETMKMEQRDDTTLQITMELLI